MGAHIGFERLVATHYFLSYRNSLSPRLARCLREWVGAGLGKEGISNVIPLKWKRRAVKRIIIIIYLLITQERRKII